jgi:hypothetical protein
MATELRNLCTPAYFYLVISTIAILLMAAQNYGNTNTYCLGSYNCQVSSTILIFGIKIIYVIFWTWILNLMCKTGDRALSWFFVLVPFVLLFAVIFFSLF